MGGRCGNPYCNSSDPEMRSPTTEELNRFKGSFNSVDEIQGLLNSGQVRLLICTECGVWTAEKWDEKEKRTEPAWVPSPFRFDIGSRLKVTLEGKRYGMVGTLNRRDRLAKTIVPPPVPENYYWLVFEDNWKEEAYREDYLELVK